MHEPIADKRLMNVTAFRIADEESSVRAMTICHGGKLALEIKDIFLKICRKRQHILLFELLSLKLIPR